MQGLEGAGVTAHQDQRRHRLGARGHGRLVTYGVGGVLGVRTENMDEVSVRGEMSACLPPTR